MFQTFDPPAAPPAGAPRLAALRARLAEMGVDGLLVPRADAHQGEVIAPSEARLPWLTGFTGSAGIAVVLAERAALLVDGRYTLQAAAQTDAAAIEVVPSQTIKLADWIAGAAREGSVIGYDPWLHGIGEIERLAKALEAGGRRLEALPENPIDALWEDRPAPPMAGVHPHPDALAGESAAAKRRRLGIGLAEAGADLAVLTLPDSIAWLLNIRGGDLSHLPVALGFATLAADARVRLFMAPDKLGGPVRDHLGEEVAIAPVEAFAEALDGLGGRRVLLDEASCPAAVRSRLSAAGAEVVLGEDPCLLAKARKNGAELAGIRAAHERDGAAMVRALAWISEAGAAGQPLSEIAIAERIEAERAATGALLDISFDTICGSGPHGAIVHYRVTRESDRMLSPGEILLVDSGGQYRDGTTDITRTVAFGPVAEGVARPYTLVLKGLIAISSARWPAGLTGRDLDPLARAALWRAGYDYDHGTGHGVGAYLSVHEGPAGISRRSGKVALEPGMVLSNEPGHYREGAFGIRLENLVSVTAPSTPPGGDREMLGFEDLTLCPFDRRLILAGLLSAEEIAWLDAYHARVRETLSPLLEPDPKAWLEAATAPLG